MTRSSSSTACWSRPRRSSLVASRAEPWRPMPTANRAWMAPSCSSLAIRSRSSSTARRWSSRWRRAYSRATAACSAKVSTSCTARLSRSGGPPLAVGHRQRAEGAAAHGQGDEHRRPGPGGHDRLGGARSSAPASARATALPVRMTSPVTEPSAGKIAPSSWPASSPSAASTARCWSSVGRARVARSAPTSARAWPHDQPEQLGGVGPGQDRGADGPDGLQPLGAVVGLLVQVGGLDGHARPGRPAGSGPARRRGRSPPRRRFSVR